MVEVDRSGTLVRITPANAAEEVRAILAKTGMKAELLSFEKAAQAVAGATAWFSRATIRELSREEFRVLGRRWAAEIKQEASLSDDQESKLVESLDRAFDQAVARMRVEEGVPKNAGIWKRAKAEAIERVVEESSAFLTRDQAAVVRAGLEGKL